MNLSDISPRSRAAALALCAVLGPFGAHRFYAGKPATGVAMLFTLGGLGIWWLYDVILLSAGSFRDGDGKRIVNWLEADVPGRTRDRRVQNDLLLEELDGVRAEVADLAERVDFMERMLTKVQNRSAIPRGDV
ncbi:MAG: TM2 domain-containing protein [Gemmatimonadales bacterium]